MDDLSHRQTYEVRSTSRRSASVTPQVLSLRENDDESATRRLILPTIVSNSRNPAAAVRIEFTHQRRHKRDQPWADVEAFDLRRQRSGEEIRLDLDSEETLRLYEHLRRLYEIGKQGVQPGDHLVSIYNADDLLVLQGATKEIVARLLESEDGEELLRLIDTARPNRLGAFALAREHERRQQVVEQFSIQFASDDWSENEWQSFFEANDWIFGRGLAYQFLTTSQPQPHVGGLEVTGRGDQRGDFLMATEAAVKFSVLVELKLPTTPLLGPRYRNGAWEIGSGLSSGVAQVQANCYTWALEGSRTAANQERLRQEGTSVIQPRGILVIGGTNQLKNDRLRVQTFELFRRNLTNPEVITYDELLERARFIVGDRSAKTWPAAVLSDEPPWPEVAPSDLNDPDEVPF